MKIGSNIMSIDNKENLFNSSSGAFVEELFARYSRDPSSVDQSWQTYFEELSEDTNLHMEAGVGASWERKDWPNDNSDDLMGALNPGFEFKYKKALGTASDADIRKATLDSIRCLMMIRTYRVRGHLHANLDPLRLTKKPYHSELDPETYGFGEGDLDREIFLDNVLGLESATVREVLKILDRTYCSTFGVEFMHINSAEEKGWILEKIEGRDKEIQFSIEGKKAISYSEACIMADKIDAFLKNNKIKVQTVGAFTDSSLIRVTVEKGGVIGFLPQSVVRQSLKYKTLVKIGELPNLKFSLWAVTLKTYKKDSLIDSLLKKYRT